MEQIVIYGIGSKYYSAGAVKYELPSEAPLYAPSAAKQQRQHMANDYVQITLQSTETLSVGIGDYIEVRGCRYSIRAVSDITRIGEDNFTYNITFYGAMYNLMRYRYRDTPVNGRSAQNTFDLTLSLNDMVKVIVNNVLRGEGISEENIAQSPWLFDEESCPDTDPITMSFDKQNCLTALQNICQQFEVEFCITQEWNETYQIWQCTIHVGEFGEVVNNTPFEYGEGNGLYQLQETKVDDSCIVNRLWVEGSTENILSGYRGYSMRLQLPRKDVPLLGSGATRRYSRKEHTIEIDGEKYIFAAGYPIGIDEDESRFVDEANLYEGSEDVIHGKWKKEGEESWRYAPFNPSGLITRYGILEDSVVFDDVKPSPTFHILKLWPTNGTSTPNSRQSFFCDVDFDLAAIWTDVFMDFREWCLLKTQLIPSEAQYNACKIVYDDNTTYEEDADLWIEYRREIGDGTIQRVVNPYTIWRQQHHSAAAPDLPTLPADYDQDIYAEYEIFRKYLLQADNSKYLIDGGQAAFIDGKCAGIDFDIGSFIDQSKLTATQREPILFSTSQNYAIGDICIRVVNSQIKAYRFTSAHQGYWNSTHVTEIHLGLLTVNLKEEQDTGDVFPSEDEFGAFRLAPGDKFKLVSIYFPYHYYEDAEEELWFAAYEKFESVKYPSMRYKLTFDQMFVEENQAVFEAILPGDYITISDDRFGITAKKMRVTQVDCDLLTNRDYQVTLESVHKQRTRTGIRIDDYNNLVVALREVGLDDPRYRRNNRTSGSGAISHLTANGFLRAERVADEFVATRMLADQAISAAKILDGAVSRAKIALKAIGTSQLDDQAVTNTKIKSGDIALDRLVGSVVAKINRVSVINTLQRFINNGSMSDRHYTGNIEYKDGVLTLDNVCITDSLAKATLKANSNVWSNGETVDLDFTSSEYDSEESYDVYAVLSNEGTMDYIATKQGEEPPDEYMKLGEVSAEVDGERTFTQEVGTTYLSDGVIRDGDGNAILDIKNGLLRGALKFDGLKDGSNNNLDIISILGALPTTAGGLRKMLADNIDIVGADANSGLRFYVGDLIDKVGEDMTDTGGLLYITDQLNTYARSTLRSKINEMRDSLYSANEILLSIQSNFNTMRSQLINRSLINQSSDSGTVSELGIGKCVWNPLQQQEQCVTDPAGIGIPDRLT